MRRDYARVAPITGYGSDEHAVAARLSELGDASVVLGADVLLRDEWVAKSKATAAAYTAAEEPVILVDTSGGGVTITLPPVAAATDRVYVVKKTTTDGNTVTIDGDGAETIDGGATITFTTSRGVRWLYCDGSAWHVLN